MEPAAKPELPYPVRVESGSLAKLGEFVQELAPAHRCAILTDVNVAPLYGRATAGALGLDAGEVLVIPAGEASKTRGTWGWVTDELLARGFGRDSTIIALGGGSSGTSRDSSPRPTCGGSRSSTFRPPCWR